MSPEVLVMIILGGMSLIIIIAVIVIMSKTKKPPITDPLSKEIQHTLLERIGKESNIKRHGNWRESPEAELVLLTPDAGILMGKKRLKRFNSQNSVQKTPVSLEPISRYTEQDLSWDMVYGHKKEGRRYDLRALGGGPSLAIAEVYDPDFRMGFAAQVGNRYYLVREWNISDAKTNVNIARMSNPDQEEREVRFADGRTFRYYAGDQLVLTDNPAILKPALFTDENDYPLVEWRYMYKIRISSATPEDTLPVFMLFTFAQDTIINH